MFARIRAAWKRRQEKQHQALVDRTTYEAEERQRESQTEPRTFRDSRKPLGPTPGAD